MPLTRRTRYEREPAQGGRRALALLVVLLIASAALGSWHRRALARGRPSPLTRAAETLVGPFRRAAAWAVRGVSGASASLRDSRSLAAENQRLRLALGDLREQNRDLSRLADENQRLRRLLDVRRRLPHHTVAAAVIGRDLEVWKSALILDRGRRDGIRPRQVVVGLDGLLGQVVSVSERTARVLPVTDPASGVGALVVRTGEAGVLKGTGGSCRLRYLPLHAGLRPGDAVITSGLGGVFPQGIALGAVTQVSRDPTTSTTFAVVQTAQDPNRAREVLVITTPAPGSALSGAASGRTQDPPAPTPN